ncbi:DUF883 family protein [Frateuria sp. MAH-13]|uniref:DUF883 family protein n=2 Tax=Frateuria flava TaxID=2821489 RepID=A0ABS4DPI2_9GAMM|nr:DUF883 family protein [Frateuria flava]
MNPIQSSSTPRDPGHNPAVPNPSMAADASDGALADAGISKTHTRIDQGAERVKQATSDAVERTKQAVNHTADKVEAGVHRAADKTAGAAHRASDKAADLSERGRQMRDETMDKAELWMEQAREYVREKPMQSLAMAVGAGWLLGRILRR